MKFKKFFRALGFVIFFLAASNPYLSAQGHIEFGVHFSSWSIDLLGNLIEDVISDALETDLNDLAHRERAFIVRSDGNGRRNWDGLDAHIRNVELCNGDSHYHLEWY